MPLEDHWLRVRVLEPQVHWDATGTTLADASTQWCSSGDPVLICIIGTYWKTTGKPLEDHWKHWLPTFLSPVAFQCTLGYRFQAHWIATGRPLAQGKGLEPQVHWDATGTILADASTQWCSSGNPVLICIIGTYWKTTGRPLETHWLPTFLSPVAFQCTLGSKFQAHWIATGRPLAQGKGGVNNLLLYQIMLRHHCD